MLRPIFLPSLLPAFACVACAWSHNDPLVAPAPADIRLELETPKTTYFIGEPCRVKLAVRNTGKSTVLFEFGGDYRGLNRSERFIVGLFDDHGADAPALPASGFAGGGMIGRHELKPGEKWETSLWPLDYRKIPGPGRYTLKITHDFGWNGDRRADRFQKPAGDEVFADKHWKSPVGELTLVFAVPDEKQIEAILDDIETAIRAKNDAGVPEPKDLARPEFFAALKRRLEHGGERLFLHALAEIRTRETTAVLLDIARREKHPLAVEAAELLFRRLPELSPRYTGLDVASVWDDTMKPEVIDLGRRLLSAYATPDLPLAEADRRVIAGARIATGIAVEAHYEPLCAALEKVLDRCTMPRRHAGSSEPDPERPASDLLQALDRLQKKYPRDYENFSGNAGLFLRFRYASPDTEERRKRLIEHANIFGETSNRMIRVAALRALPKPLPEESGKFVAASLDSHDFGVVAAACDVAGDSGNTSWVPDLLLVIRAENEEIVLRAAARAAQKLGARRDLADALADRLIDADMNPTALDLLRDLVVKDDGSRGGATGFPRKTGGALQTAWKAWIPAHAEDLARGVKFKPGDDQNLPPALFEPMIQWTIPGRGRWPGPATENR